MKLFKKGFWLWFQCILFVFASEDEGGDEDGDGEKPPTDEPKEYVFLNKLTRQASETIKDEDLDNLLVLESVPKDDIPKVVKDQLEKQKAAEGAEGAAGAAGAEGEAGGAGASAEDASGEDKKEEGDDEEDKDESKKED